MGSTRKFGRNMETKYFTDRAEYDSARALYEVQTDGYFAAIYDWERRLESATKWAYEYYGGLTVLAGLAVASFSGVIVMPITLLVALGIGLRWYDKSVLENRRVTAFTRVNPRPTFSGVKPIWRGPKMDKTDEEEKRDERSKKRADEFNPGSQTSPVARSARMLRLNGKLTKKEIKKHYREMLMQYHPDKVATLGPEIRELAERKTKELNEAYEVLEKHFGL